MEAGVAGVRPVVPHHEEAAGRDPYLELHRGGLVARMDVRLVQGCSVDAHPALGVAALDGVAAGRDNTLDQVLLVGGREQSDEGEPLLDALEDDGIAVAAPALLRAQPVPRVLEHDHVAPVRLRPEPGRQLVDEHPVADTDGLLHRARRDHEGLDQEGLEDERDEYGDAHEEGYLRQGGTSPTAPHTSRATSPLRPPRVRRAAVGGTVHGDGAVRGGRRFRGPSGASAAPTHALRRGRQGHPRTRHGAEARSSGSAARRPRPHGR